MTTHAQAIAGINDIPVSSKLSPHPKTQPGLVRSRNIKVPVVSVGALDPFESTGTPKSAGFHLRYVMHLATPLISLTQEAIQDDHPCAGYRRHQ
jgi:hypothetical protein